MGRDTSKLFASRWPRLARRALMRMLGASLLVPSTLDRAESAGGVPDEGSAVTSTRSGAQIWTRSFRDQRIWGYIDRHSVRVGETFALMLSLAPGGREISGHVEFFRIGDYPDGQKRIWSSPSLRVTHQPISLTAASIGANWTPSVESIDTVAWPAGYYSADFIEDATGAVDMQVAQVIVRTPERAADVLFKVTTNTYQAYNAWGGHSLYPSETLTKRGAIVSFDRPTNPSFFEYDLYLVRWLERLAAAEGFSIDYASNFDVHAEPDLIDRYRLVICGAHDEYWSKEEFDAFERRIFGRGANTIFFGANTAYWQVRYADVDRPPDGGDRGRQLITYKGLNDPILRRTARPDALLLATAEFRGGNRRPETMLLGVGYQNWFNFDSDGSPRFAYTVESTDQPFFVGTGYKKGDFVADVVGYEWDNRDPAGDGGRLWAEGRSRIAMLPADNLHVLFSGAPVGANGAAGRAEAVYFRSVAGAKVFSSGSIRWAWGLGKSGFEQEAFKRLNRNLVLYFLDRSL